MMIKEAVKAGVKHTIITHPLLDVVDMTPEQIKQAVALGPEIYAEFTSQFGSQSASPETVKQYVEGIRAAGADHAFVSSDTGQVNSDFQPDALAKCAKVLRANGFSEQEVAKLFKVNPAKILGIAPPAGTQ
jgi:predicted metal-dependent TIM-barrel fold hydrolase